MMSEYWNSEASFVGTSTDGVHDLIIHGLNRSIEYSGKPMFFPVEPFKASEQAWDGIPAVYVPNGVHIPPELLTRDPETALKKYGGEIVGKFNNTRVFVDGIERLQSQTSITNEHVEQGIQDGNIGISSTFYARHSEGQVTGPIIPSYVLLFDKDKEHPRDPFSSFLNTMNTLEDTSMADIDVKVTNLERDIKEKDGFIAMMNTKSDEKDSTITALKADIEEKDLLMNSMAADKDAKIKSLEDELIEFKNTKADADWADLKAGYIPPGLVATPELESELRVLHNTDAGAFIKKVASVARPPETDKDGSRFNNTNSTDDDDTGAIDELKKLTGRFY